MDVNLNNPGCKDCQNIGTAFNEEPCIHCKLSSAYSSKTEKYISLCKELMNIYHKMDLSFFVTYQELGIISAITRIQYENNKIKACVKNDLTENLRESLLELANYCLMTVMEIE